MMFGLFGKKKEETSELKSVFVSETGLVRKDNQDNALVAVHSGVFCVADGMGGGAEGAHASEIVCKGMKLSVHAAGNTFDSLVAMTQHSIVESNTQIFQYAKSRGYAQMGSTVAVLVFDPETKNRAAVLHVGDSRVYRIRRGLSELLTHDHRVPGTNALIRAVGGSETVRVDHREIDVKPGDRFLLCSDGVSCVVSDARMAVFVGGGKIDTAAGRLAGEVMKAGAPDNFTFIIVEA